MRAPLWLVNWLAKKLRAVALALAGLVLVIYLTPLVEWWARAYARPWHAPAGDVLVVLGGSGLEDGTIGINSYWRTVYAARLWKKVRFRRVVLCGGPPGYPVSAGMRNLLMTFGVPEHVIEVETVSRSTRENATAARRLLEGDPGRILLVTSDYHMYRAQRVFRRAGLETMAHPIPDALKRNNFWQERGAIFYELVLETAKILYYRYQGWMD